MLNHTLLVDDERRALRKFVARAPDLFQTLRHSIQLEYLAIRVTEQREVNINLFRVCGVRRGTVTAHTKNDRVTGFQLGPISLIGFQFTGSGVGEGKDVEDDDHVLLAAKVAEFDFLPFIAQQREVGCFVSWPKNPGRRDVGTSGGCEREG